ncbi:hypothetical protein M408DRAFT_29763 [Serendipita vermifera MAFF 305830]|uniref:Autophagy-related protein 27 n=1 Tax=Serendipita vermifera MAFF 305830 TaxID=933852 RepID=A0A0C2WUX7_SERVB|nr:hypothetical protein M408DRAFT_29763 [Serendipita vermifera MAFF 305830]
MILIALHIYLLFGVVGGLYDRSNDDTSWDGNSVQANQAGRFCYFPAPNKTNTTYCSGGHTSDTKYQPVMDIHLNLAQGWSIAYYSGSNVLLGDVSFPVPTGVNDTRQCLSGRAGDGTYQTLCMTTTHDNNIVEAGSYCLVATAQHYVSDGCYAAVSNETSTSDSSAPTGPTSATGSSPSGDSGSNNSQLITIVTSVVVPLVVSILGIMAVLFQSKRLREAFVDHLCCCLTDPRKENLKAKGRKGFLEGSEKSESKAGSVIRKMRTQVTTPSLGKDVDARVKTYSVFSLNGGLRRAIFEYSKGSCKSDIRLSSASLSSKPSLRRESSAPIGPGAERKEDGSRPVLRSVSDHILVLSTMAFVALYLLLGVVHGRFDTFNENTTWAENSVQANNAGTFCYFPAPNQITTTYCKGGHSSDASYQPLMDIHLNLAQGWSIAYYSGSNVPLGDVNFPVPKYVTNTRQCLSGQASDGTYQTMCMTTTQDNNIVEPGPYCQVALAQRYVSDGCYNAMSSGTSTSGSSGQSPGDSGSNTRQTPTVITTIVGPLVTSDSTTPSLTVSRPLSNDSGSNNGQLATIIISVIASLLVAILGFFAALFQSTRFREAFVDSCCCCLLPHEKDKLKARGGRSLVGEPQMSYSGPKPVIRE